MEKPQVWYVVVMQTLKHSILGQYLEVDVDAPGGYTLHLESGSFPNKLMCFDFGLMDFKKTTRAF
jgi:hypothetical protein